MHALPPVIKSINHTHTEEPAHPVPLATPIAPETPAVHPHESLPREDKPSAPPDYPPPPRDDPSLSETHETKQQPEQLAQQDLSEIMEESIIVSQQVAAMESFSGDTIENDQPAEDCTRSSILSRKVSDTVNVFESMGGAQEKTQSSHHALGQFDASYVNDQIAVMERFKNALTDNSSDSSDDSQPAHAIPQVSSLENWSDARDDSRLNVPTVQSEEFIPRKLPVWKAGPMQLTTFLSHVNLICPIHPPLPKK